MKAPILAVFLAASLAIPVTAQANEQSLKTSSQKQEKAQAHRAQKHEENKDFRDSLKDIPQGQRKEAMINHRQSQFAEKMAEHAQRHEQKMTELRARLAANTELTAIQKQEIIAKAEREYQERVIKAKARQAENLNHAQQVFNDKSLSLNEKKEKMKAHRDEMKEERKDLKQEGQAKREQLREEFKMKNRGTTTQAEKK